MRIFVSTSRNVQANLAFEESLFDGCASPGAEPVLFFCVNAPCVVVGKNQNPWREAAVGAMRADGVSLARRVSGGGAVYHDEGNLNVSMILPRVAYDMDRAFGWLVGALADVGIRAERGQSTNLFTGGRKFSGCAFAYRRQAAMHHATMLVNADLDRLKRYLVPTFPEVTGHAVASRPAETVNLAGVAPGLTVATLRDRLGDALARRIGGGAAEWVEVDPPADGPDVERYGSWAWRWGQTPAFSVRLDAGGRGVDVQVRDGVIERLAVDGAEVPSAGGRRFAAASLREVLPGVALPDF